MKRLQTADFMEKTSSNRIEYLDCLRGFAMLCVVAVHCNIIGEHLNAWISTFMIPVFMVVSGYLMSNPKSREEFFRQFTFKRFMGIMIPYFSFGAVITVFDLIQLLRGRMEGEEVFRYFLDFVTLRGRGALWFLPALFLGGLLVRLLIRTKPVVNTLISLVITLSAAFLSFPVNALLEACEDSLLLSVFAGMLHTVVRALYLCAFFRLGEILAEKYTPLQNKSASKNKEIQFRLISFISGTALLVGLWFLSGFHGIIDIHNLSLGEPISSVSLTLLGSLGIFLIFAAIPFVPPFKQLLTFWGQNSLIIMATHVEFYLLLIGEKITGFLSDHFTFMNSFVTLAVLMVFFIIIEIPICLFIRKFLPFMLGKRYPKKAS